MASPLQPVQPRPASRWRWVWVIAAGISLAILFVVMIRSRPVPVAAPDEVPRSALEVREGRWFRTGQSNAFTGFLFDTYDDGVMKSRSPVSNGLLEGWSEGWHTNGQPQVKEFYRAGVSHGLRTKWYDDGRKLSEVPVVNGKLEGTFRRWNPDGSLAEEVELKDGQPDGLSRAYYPSGFVKAEAHLRAGQVVEQQAFKDGENQAPVPVRAGQ